MTSNFMKDLSDSTPGSVWIDASDRATWFEDADLTVPTTAPSRVRYLKNKAGPGWFSVGENGLGMENGRYCYEMPGDDDRNAPPFGTGLWQDVERRIPVTQSGQSVAAMDVKSDPWSGTMIPSVSKRSLLSSVAVGLPSP